MTQCKTLEVAKADGENVISTVRDGVTSGTA